MVDGADPCIEDPGTLWLLHWQLAATPSPASTWHLAFTCWSERIFSRDELARWLLKEAGANGATRCSTGSIARDADVFLRTYLPAREDKRRPVEDGFDCPLAELGLLRRVDRGHFAFERGPRPSLPDGIVAFAVADFWRRTASEQRTLALERALFGAGSPGGAFKLRDRDLVERLERLPASTGLRYDETAGQRAIYREKPRAPLDLLSDYYSSGHYADRAAAEDG